MAIPSGLCDYCTHVKFEQLHPPSWSDFQQHLQGTELSSQSSSQSSETEDRTIQLSWSLGLHGRVKGSAASCAFCFAICMLLEQNLFIHEVCKSGKHLLDQLVCVATIGRQDTVGAPKQSGSTWIPLGLERLSLYWCQMNDRNLGPGLIDLVDDSDTGLSMHDCFLACNQDTLESQPMIRLLEDKALAPSNFAFSGRKRPRIFDTRLPDLWLSECLLHHGAKCSTQESSFSPDKSRPLSIYRLIDVNTKAIEEFRNIDIASLKYTALSYVWGGPQSTILLQNTLENMKTPGYFESDSIPATIKDAIKLTRSLGMSYVWIDALCIIQDSQEDKNIQLSRMSEIYSYALVTIAAGDGSSVHSGLPGVSTPRTADQIEIPLRGGPDRNPMNLLTGLTPRRDQWLPLTDQCVWGSRAWTLQEQALSKRVLLFMNQQVIWLCACAHWSEEIALETRLAAVNLDSLRDATSLNSLTFGYVSPDNNNRDGQITKDPEDYTIWGMLSLLVRAYKMRKLTNPGDSHDAFLGILTAIADREGVSFLWGLNTSLFETSLCWTPLDLYPPLRLHCLTSREITPLKRQVPLPSWSWLGWTGHHDIVGAYEARSYIMKIKCYILRNFPLRLDLISPRLDSVIRAISLEDIQKSGCVLTNEQPDSIPDDQYVCFWAETLWITQEKTTQLNGIKGAPEALRFFTDQSRSFMVSELFSPQKDDGSSVEQLEALFGPAPETKARIVIDCKSHRVVGRMDPCRWHEDNEEFGLVFLGQKPGFGDQPHSAIILEVQRRDGICWRRNIGSIDYPAWTDAHVADSVIVLN